MLLPADLVTRLACHQPGSGGCGRKKPALFSSNLSSLCSRGKKPVCWSGAGLGPGPGCRVKRDRTQVDVRVLLGSVGRRQFLAGPGRRPAKTRGRAAAGHIPPPSPPHCRESYSASGNQEIVECCLLCVKLDIVTRVAPLGSLAMEV